MRTLARGTAIVLGVQVRDPTQIPAVFTDPTSITVTLLNPDGTTYQAATAMTQQDIGIYSYVRQTSTSDPVGAYAARITAIAGSNTVITLYDVAFVLA